MHCGSDCETGAALFEGKKKSPLLIAEDFVTGPVAGQRYKYL
jgi:hypothetical protein